MKLGEAQRVVIVSDDLPEGWEAFAATLPPNLYAKFQARAEAEGASLELEAAYLLAYALDNAPRPSEATLEPLTDPERAEALQVRMHMGALAVGAAQRAKAEDDSPQETG